MANKIGILNSILIFFINNLALIPLGIYLSEGLSSYTGIPMVLINIENTQFYSWGVIDLGTAYLWTEYAPNKGLNFLLLGVTLTIAYISTFIGSFVESDKGKKAILTGLILEILTIAFLLIDGLFLGTYIVGTVVQFTNFGLGFYYLIISIILQAVAFKIQPEDINE